MPIKKILVTEEMVKKIEAGKSGESIPVLIAIPTGTAPESVGEYILQEIRQKHSYVAMSSTTSNTISFIAQESAKEGWGLKGIKISLIPPNVEFEWGKTKKE